MIQELAPRDFKRVAGLFALLDEHLAVWAVLAGETPGQVFVDDTDEPRVAVLFPWNRHRVYLAGAADDDGFNQGLVRLLAARYAPEEGEAEEFVVYFAPDGWETHREAIVPGAVAAVRQYCELDGPPAGQPELPPGLELVRVDAALLADTRVPNLEQLVEEMHSESHSLEDFLSRKLGHCVRDGDLLAGWCLSEYNHGDRCELGVETLEEYQRQGIGTAAVLATVTEASARGINRIGWHCWQRNVPSAALARRAGFAHVKDYPTWYCRFESGE
ncbi:MAG: GNAT family N-acetyltransferase [Chloroflexia bacterium]